MSVKEVMTNLADAARARYSVSSKLTVTDITDLIQGENADVAKLIDRSITKVEISEGVTEIGKEAFRGCSQLTEVTLPSTITSIGENAFADCTALDNVYCNWVEDEIEGAPWGATEDTSFIYSNTPLGFMAFTDNSSVTLNKVNEPLVEGLLYKRYSESSWSPYICGTTIELQAGEAVFFRNTTSALNWVESKDITQASTYHYVQFHMTGVVRSGGDIRSMFNMNDELPPYGCFRMFKDCTALHSDAFGILELPATTLASNCYREMFSGCTGMIYPPTLPATTLASNCYREMFSGCTGLIEEPELPATTLAAGCYEGMFYHCSALTSTPTLPATVLKNDCYKSMFEGCTALKNINRISAEEMSGLSCYRMFCNNTSLESVYEGFLTGVTELSTGCCRSMFKGCVALTHFSGLPETLKTASKCYNEMFSGCSSLVNIKVGFQDWGGGECTTDWLLGVAATGTFTKSGELATVRGSSYIPDGWEIDNTSLEILPLTFRATRDVSEFYYDTWGEPVVDGLMYRRSVLDAWQPYYSNSPIEINKGDVVQVKNVKDQLSTSKYDYVQFKAVAVGDLVVTGNMQSMLGGSQECKPYCFYRLFSSCGITTAPDLPFAKLATHCYSKMFSGCSYLQKAPELKVTMLEPFCYQDMFNGCDRLKTAPELPAPELVDGCYQGMFKDCPIHELHVGFTEWMDSALDGWLDGVGTYGVFYSPGNVFASYSTENIPTAWTRDSLTYDYLTFTALASDVSIVLDAVGNPDVTGLLYKTNEMDNFTPYTIGQEITLNHVNDFVQFNRETTVDKTTYGSGNYLSFDTNSKVGSAKFSFIVNGDVGSLFYGTRTIATVFPYCYANLFTGCDISQGPALRAKTLSNGCYKNMFRSSRITHTPKLPATELAYDCYHAMFYGCTYLEKAYDLPTAIMGVQSYYSMFESCRNLVKAPQMGSTFNVNSHSRMFFGCSSLSEINVGFSDWLYENKLHTTDWVANVASSGIFTKPSNLPTEYGTDYIPEGWTVINK